MKTAAPTLGLDLYADDVVEDSTAAFQTIRDAGAIVRLPRNRMWAIGRFEDLRVALRDDDLFTSDHGVAANPITNSTARLSILMSDGDTHARRRGVMMRSLGAKAILPTAEQLDEEADALVRRLVGAGEFEAVRDFAAVLPLNVVAELVGLRVSGEQLLHWGSAVFDTLGPLNRRWQRANPTSLTALVYALRMNRAKVVPGGWAAAAFDAADRGEISRLEASAMVLDFIVPSLDTTIISTAHMLWLLGCNVETWERLRQEPELIPAAVVEAVRISSPVRCFTRRVSRDASFSGVGLRARDRVAMLFGAANMDERHFPDPSRFDLDRPPGGNLGWGNGPHTCIGIHLAKLEMQAVLRALIAHVETIEVAANPPRIRSNTLQGLAALPARLN